MAKGLFQDSKIVYLSLEQASKPHSLWDGKNLDMPLDAISPAELIDLLGMDAEDEWLEWLTISHPIVLVEKQAKTTEGDQDQTPLYYRIMGHSTFYYLTQYLGNKYGADSLKKTKFPMTIIPQKKLSRLQNSILNNELVFSFLLQKSKQHRDLMQSHIMSSPAPIPSINSHRQLSRFAKISHSSLSSSKPTNQDKGNEQTHN